MKYANSDMGKFGPVHENLRQIRFKSHFVFCLFILLKTCFNSFYQLLGGINVIAARRVAGLEMQKDIYHRLCSSYSDCRKSIQLPGTGGLIDIPGQLK